MSEFLPVLPQQIAEAALDAAEAGAAVVHMHARDPRDGRPSQNPAHFEPILLTLKANTDAVLNGAEIGSGSIVAARTVILEGMVIPSSSLVAGVPGKVRRHSTTDEVAAIVTNADRYCALKALHEALRGHAGNGVPPKAWRHQL